jgi:hypothetical protein
MKIPEMESTRTNKILFASPPTVMKFEILQRGRTARAEAPTLGETSV